jgi:hypothetical protein
MDFDQTDLLGHPLAVPSPELLQALASPNLLEVLAAARLMRALSPILRGDGATAGWTVLTDGIPAVFPIPSDHNLRRLHAALAGLIEEPVLNVLEITRPTDSEIRAEMCRLAGDAAKRFEAAAAWLSELGESSHE